MVVGAVAFGVARPAHRRRAARPGRARARRLRPRAGAQALGVLRLHRGADPAPGSRCAAGCSSAAPRPSRSPASRGWWSASRCCGGGWAGPGSTCRSPATATADDLEGRPAATTVMPVAPRALVMDLARHLLRGDDESAEVDPDALAMTPPPRRGAVARPGRAAVPGRGRRRRRGRLPRGLDDAPHPRRAARAGAVAAAQPGAAAAPARDWPTCTWTARRGRCACAPGTGSSAEARALLRAGGRTGAARPARRRLT